MARKGLIIGGSIAGAVIVIAILGIVVALNMVNNEAEKQVTRQLDQAIASSGLEELMTYESVDVQVARGRVEVRGVELSEEGESMTAEAVSVTLPPGEALALARDPENATITDIAVDARGFEFSSQYDGSSFTLDRLGLNAQGNVSTALFGDNPEAALEGENPGLTLLSMNASGLGFSIPEDGGSMSLSGFEFEAKGDVSAADLEVNPTAALRRIESVSAEISEFTMEPDPAALEGIRAFVGPVPLLEDPGNWNVESFAVSAGMTEDGVELRSVSAKSKLVEFEGVASMGLSQAFEPLPPLEMDLDVASYHEDLRPVLEFFAQSMPTPVELPEGNAFSFSMLVGEDGMPEITLE